MAFSRIYPLLHFFLGAINLSSSETSVSSIWGEECRAQTNVEMVVEGGFSSNRTSSSSTRETILSSSREMSLTSSGVGNMHGTISESVST